MGFFFVFEISYAQLVLVTKPNNQGPSKLGSRPLDVPSQAAGDGHLSVGANEWRKLIISSY